MRPLDEQQARLADRLRAAKAEPVSFDELRSEGIENPAMLCYELEVAGLRISRVHRRDAAGQTSVVGVRLEEPDSLEQPAEPTPSPPGGLMRAWVAARPVRPWTGALALALAIAGVAGATLALTHHGSGSPTSMDTHRSGARAPGVASPVQHRSPRRTSVTPNHAAQAGRGSGGPTKPSAAESTPRAHTPISPAVAARLQAEGHQLLGQGRYPAAVSHLRAALAASGQSLNRCTEPVSQACLTYAYALYDLGRALRLDGQPTEAVPVLSQRLTIDNQRPTVQYELNLARRQLQKTPAAGSPTHG